VALVHLGWLLPGGERHLLVLGSSCRMGQHSHKGPTYSDS
jgi:hypothetical protein